MDGTTRCTRLSPFACDPFRSPAWRWQRAAELRQQHQPPDLLDDATIQLALRFQQELAEANTELRRRQIRDRWPDLATACDLFETGGTVRDEVDGWLLAGLGIEAINDKTGLAVPVLAIYVDLFFAVFQMPRTISWIFHQVIGRENWQYRPPTERETWCHAALVGGPVLLEILITDHHDRPNAGDSAQHRLAESLRHLVLEYAAVLWPDYYPTAQLLEEGCRRFTCAIHREIRESGNALMSQQIAVLRAAYGLPLPDEDELFTSHPRPTLSRHGEAFIEATVVELPRYADSDSRDATQEVFVAGTI